MESEHDQLVRMTERVKILREWLTSQHYHSDVDEYQSWEELKNETYSKVEQYMDWLFQLNGKNKSEV